MSADVAAADLLLLVDRFRGSGGLLSAEPRPALLGAALTADHRQRLSAALLATDGLSHESFRFYKLVAGWNAAAAREWLVRALGAPESSWDESDNGMWWLGQPGRRAGRRDPAGPGVGRHRPRGRDRRAVGRRRFRGGAPAAGGAESGGAARAAPPVRGGARRLELRRLAAPAARIDRPQGGS